MKLFAVLIFFILPVVVFAVEPDEMLQDPVLEKRAREVSKELRCVVCQNQDIDSSNAGVARDLRILVRDRLTAGDSNQDVLNYVHARYGDYVLMRPPFKLSTVALWFAPLLFVLLSGVVGWIVLSSKRRQTSHAGLTEKEEAEITRFIDCNKIGDKQ